MARRDTTHTDARRRTALLAATLVLALGLGAGLLAGCTGEPPSDTYSGLTSRTPGAAAGDDTTGAARPALPPVTLELAWTGFEQPLHLTHAGDGSGRIFIVEKGGVIRTVDVDDMGAPDARPYLDVSDTITTSSERGLLSVAFSSDFANDRRLYVYYTDTGGDTVVARMIERDGVADPASEEVLLRATQPFSNHNGGQLAFGPDGYLYVGLGDGGSSGDPQDNGQDPSTLLGAILRLDVSGDSGYVVPPDNPFASGGGAPEIWAWGLRNPWRFSFDVETGRLWIGDVGQNAWEEIDVLEADAAGANLGWRVYEGTHLFEPDDPRPKEPVEPVLEYGRDEGVSITGGFVYRGDDIPGLEGTYLYGDYGSGTIWGLDAEADSYDADTTEAVRLFETDLAISSFGEDEDGELYVVDIASGGVYRIVPGR